MSLFTPDSPDPFPSLPLFLSALSGSLCRLLLELLELLFDKFKAVAQAHSVVLTHLKHIGVQAQEEGIKLYEQADVSAKIQTVLQVSWQQQWWKKCSRYLTMKCTKTDVNKMKLCRIIRNILVICLRSLNNMKQFNFTMSLWPVD